MRRLLLIVAFLLSTIGFASAQVFPGKFDSPSDESRVEQLIERAIDAIESGQLDDAIERLLDARVQAQRTIRGGPHSYQELIDRSLVKLLVLADRYDECEPFLKGLVDINRRVFKQDDTTLAYSIHALARFYTNESRIDEAVPLYREAVAISRRLFRRKPDPAIAEMFEGVALFFEQQGNFEEAEALYEEALDSYRRVYLGADHSELPRALTSVAFSYQRRGAIEDATPLYEEALEVQRRLSAGNCDPSLLYYIDNLGSFYESVGRHSDAERLFDEALTICRVLYTETDSAKLAEQIRRTAMHQDKLNNFKRAEVLYQEALEINRSLYGASDDPTLALSLNELGRFFLRQGRYADAEPLFHESLAMYRRIFSAVDNGDLATILNDMAGFAGEVGRYEEADSLYREALAMQLRLHPEEDHPAVAQAINNLAALYNEIGRYGEAEQLYRRALDIRRRLYLGQDHPDLATSLNSMAFYLQGQGRNVEAEPLYRGALAMKRRLYHGADDNDLALSILNLAVFLNDDGQNAEAEQLYAEALEMYRRLYDGVDHPNLATAIDNMAGFLNDRGRFDEATPLYEEALAMRRRLYDGVDTRALSPSLHNMAAAYLDQRKYEEAENLFIEDLELQRRLTRGEDHPELARALGSLAFYYDERGRAPEAEAMYREALAMYRRLYAGTDHDKVAVNASNLALFYDEQGRYAEAESLIEEAVGMMRRIYEEATHEQLFAMLTGAARIYLHVEKVDRAISYTQQAQSVLAGMWRSSSGFETEWEQLQLRSMLIHHVDAILSSYAHHLDHSPGLASDMLQASFLSKNSVLESVQERRRMLFVLSGDNDTVRQLWSDYQRLREQLVRLYSDPPSVGDDYSIWAAWNEKVEPTAEAINRVEKELTRRVSADGVSRQLIPVDQLREALGEHDAAIEIVRFHDFDGWRWTDSNRYVAIVIRRGDSMPTAIPLCEERQIRALFEPPPGTPGSYVSRGVEVSDTGSSTSLAHSINLYRLLWQPVDSLLEGMRTIYISPSGLLSKLSFGALSDPDGSLLADRYTLRYLFSSRDLVTRDVRSSDSMRTASVIGGAHFTSDRIESVPAGVDTAVTTVTPSIFSEAPTLPSERGTMIWGDLEGTRIECMEVAAVLRSHDWATSLDTGHRASEEILKSIQGQLSPRILHIATHGFFLPRPESDTASSWAGRPSIARNYNGMYRSGLLLSGANRAWGGAPPIEGIEDGVVTAFEVAGMDLSNTELVVLSACETGLGDIANGEGIFGLQRAFSMAGARSIIMSLWKVPDAQTVELMTLFYRNWLDKNMDRYSAFADAQRQMRMKYPPYYWAAFVMVGA